jgi:predicted AlkP superfamily pyrophosphatase or phosphodiesterase
MKTRLVTWTAVALAVATVIAAPHQAPPQPPRLVVIVVIDQMRADYVDRYAHQWTGGLKRLIDESAYFTRAAYPYGGTVTCPGHATISTGTFPASHGMVNNEWFDPRAARFVPCMHDPDAQPVAFGGGEGRERHSPRNMRRPAFADELRRQSRRPPRIVSVALKPRSAIALAGRGSPTTIAVWEEDDGTIATSQAYTRTPWPEVDAFVKAHPVAAAYGETWNRAQPAAAYVGPDDAPGEASPRPWTRTFPHKFESPTGQPDGVFVSAWERSPWSDTHVAELASALAEKLKLGTGEATDFLGISFPALDTVGHEYGPHSHEVQDVLIRLDAHLGRLLEMLDRTVGADRYVLALSSDHGVATLPEHTGALGVTTGRMSSTVIRDAVQQTLVKALGPGTYYGAYTNSHVFLQRGMADRVGARPDVINAVKAALLATPGVGRVFWRDELASSRPTTDPFLAAWRLSYVPERTGDFIVIPKINWLFRSTGTTHGSPYEYDQRVPVMLFGKGIRPGVYTTTASPADIAPTLAALVGIRMPQAEGRILTEAIVR